MTATKNVYVVLGMARSGTSAIARGLQALGVDLGDKLTPANAEWNPKGFYEDTEIVYKINRGVLFALDYTWMSVNLIDNVCCDNPKLTDLQAYAKKLLTQRMAQTTHWGFKDPRTAKVLPFWQEVFQSLQLNEHYIITLRNPLASAYSYQRVSGEDIELGLLLWLMHLYPAIEGSQGKRRMIVSYDLMLQEPRQQLERIKKTMVIPDLEGADIEEYANEFLDRKLQHYDYNHQDLTSHPAVSIAPICLKMYNLFMRLAKDELTFESSEFSNEWQIIKTEFLTSYPMYCYFDNVFKANKKLKKELQTMQRSIPWKLVYPLRLIDNFLRSRRRKARELKRLVKSYA